VEWAKLIAREAETLKQKINREERRERQEKPTVPCRSPAGHFAQTAILIRVRIARVFGGKRPQRLRLQEFGG
jgi:hypothetical protein